MNPQPKWGSGPYGSCVGKSKGNDSIGWSESSGLGKSKGKGKDVLHERLEGSDSGKSKGKGNDSIDEVLHMMHSFYDHWVIHA